MNRFLKETEETKKKNIKRYILKQLIERIEAIKYQKIASNRLLRNIINLEKKDKLPEWIYIFYIELKNNQQ